MKRAEGNAFDVHETYKPVDMGNMQIPPVYVMGGARLGDSYDEYVPSVFLHWHSCIVPWLDGQKGHK